MTEKRARKKPQLLHPAVIAAVVLAATAAICLYYAGRYLVISDVPVKSDAILVFAGDKGQRTEKAISLYKDGLAPKLVLSGGPLYMNTSAARLMYEHARSAGVPAEALILEEKADSTYENAVYCRQLMEENNFQSALVVSSEYHMRRVRLSCEKAFQGSSIKLYYCPADDPQYNPERWWASNKSMLWTVNEYLKITGYELGLTS